MQAYVIVKKKSDEELTHFKYDYKKFVNGRWRYYYSNGEETNKTIQEYVKNQKKQETENRKKFTKMAEDQKKYDKERKRKDKALSDSFEKLMNSKNGKQAVNRGEKFVSELFNWLIP